MNRFIGLIIMVTALAALIGAALGWRLPFGREQADSGLRLGTRQPTVQPANTGEQRRLGSPRTPQSGIAQAPQTTSPSGGTNLQQQPSDTTTKPPLW
jgi:predicted lipid-binding transport protein (Tim44 family)